LGRPFLKTGRTLVDVYKETITLRMGDQKVEFNINNSMKYPAVTEKCSVVYELTKQPATEEWDDGESEQEEDSRWNDRI